MRKLRMKLDTFQYTRDKGWSAELPNTDSENTLILIFAAPEFINYPAPIHELAARYPQSKMIGCSSAGEIIGPRLSDHALSVAIIKFEKSKIKITKTEIKTPDNSYKVGKAIAKKLEGKDLKNLFFLSEGLNVNGSEVIKGLNTLGSDVIITGGLAGDGSHFKQTWAIYNGEILKNYIVAVGIYGQHILVGHGSRGGWDIFGLERRITRSKNNILYEMDHKPALAIYEEYLGNLAADLPASGLLYPLAIRKDDSDSKKLVRTILAIDKEEQALIFAGDMPMGNLAQLMRGNFDRLITGASEAGIEAATTLLSTGQPKGPVLSIAISCVGRRLLLGERTEEEIEATLDTLPEHTQQIGFYSYGECSPYTDGPSDLHNQTMTVTTICED